MEVLDGWLNWDVVSVTISVLGDDVLLFAVAVEDLLQEGTPVPVRGGWSAIWTSRKISAISSLHQEHNTDRRLTLQWERIWEFGVRRETKTADRKKVMGSESVYGHWRLYPGLQRFEPPQERLIHSFCCQSKCWKNSITSERCSLLVTLCTWVGICNVIRYRTESHRPWNFSYLSILQRVSIFKWSLFSYRLTI